MASDPPHLPHRRRARAGAALPAGEGLPPGRSRRASLLQGRGHGDCSIRARSCAGWRAGGSPLRLSTAERLVASIRAYETAKGERRYEVRFRDGGHRERSRVFSVHKDARAFKLDVERRAQAGILYQAAPERFGEVASAWFERFVVGAAGRVRPRRVSMRSPSASGTSPPRPPVPRADPPAGGRGPDHHSRRAGAAAGRDGAGSPEADPARRRGARAAGRPLRLSGADRQADRARAALSHLGRRPRRSHPGCPSTCAGSCRSRS